RREDQVPAVRGRLELQEPRKVARPGGPHLSPGQVPHPDVAIRAPGDEALAVAAERRAADGEDVALPSGREQGRGLAPRLGVPDLDGLRPDPGGQASAVRAERHALAVRLARPQGELLDPGLGAPDLDLAGLFAVRRPRYEILLLGHDDAGHGLSVPPEAPDRPPRLGVPGPHGPVAAPGEDGPAVGAEADGGDRVGVALQGVDRPAGSQVPDPDGPVRAPRSEAGAVGAERQAGDRAGVADEGEGFTPAQGAHMALLPGLLKHLVHLAQ